MNKLLISFFTLTLLTSINNSLAQGTDIITMNNGNIHNGVIDNKSFNLITALGEVIIPYNHMSELHLSNKPHNDKLLTQYGDIFFGEIQNQELTILRTLDPTLPVSISEISEIHFSKKNIPKKNNLANEIIKTRHGDSFSAHFLPESVNILSSDESIKVATKNIQSIDIDKLIDDEEINIQLRSKNNKVTLGILNNSDILIKTNYSQTLKINPANISSIIFTPENRNNNIKYLRDLLTDKSLGPEMVELRSSRFIRGDNNGDSDEKPAMPVKVKTFAISTHEITFQQYDRFCNDTKRDKPDDQEWGRNSRPVVNVSWQDATAYTQWLSKKTGEVYRLPTDAEWEYAAKAGANTKYWWGNKPGIAMANCEGCNSIWSGEKTAPVGRFPANTFGLYDTAGNVFEWVADCYHNTFEFAPKDGSALDKPGCGKRVIRGGSWSFPEKESRSANRWRDFPTRRSDDTGFRVVRELD